MSEKVMMDERYMGKREDITGALTALKNVKAVTFDPQGVGSYLMTGLVGQSLKTAVPTALEIDGMGYHYVDMTQVIPVLVAAVNELNAGAATQAEAVSTLTTTVSGHTESLETLTGIVEGHTESLSTLTETVEGHTTSLSSLQGTLDTLSASVTALQQSLTTLQGTVTQLSEDVEALQAAATPATVQAKSTAKK